MLRATRLILALGTCVGVSAIVAAQAQGASGEPATGPQAAVPANRVNGGTTRVSPPQLSAPSLQPTNKTAENAQPVLEFSRCTAPNAVGPMVHRAPIAEVMHRSTATARPKNRKF